MNIQLPNLSERIVLARVRNEISRQLKDSAAPEEVHEFLLDHWTKLMTTIFMAKGNRNPDWQAGWDTMNALLWSLGPKQGRKEAVTLLRALPNLLARLQEGCVALGLSDHYKDNFFRHLSMLHAAVVREGLHMSTNKPLFPEGSLEAPIWEDADAVLTEFAPSLHDLPEGCDTGMDEDNSFPLLSVGDQVLVRKGDEEHLMILTWLSPMGGMYLFTNDAGQDALSLTRARLASKFKRGEARRLV